MRLTGKTLTVVTFLVAITFAFGCGSSSSKRETASGTLTKGPIAGATVFTDCVDDDAEANFTIDDGEYQALTNAEGRYSVRVPACDNGFVLVSEGGNEAGSDEEAPQMLAPSNAKNITPLTTLVALTPKAQQADVIAAIKALGADDFDDDINAGATPAVQFLAQSIAAATKVITNAINTGLGTDLTAAQQTAAKAQIASIQVTLAKNIAAQVVTNTAAAADKVAALNPTNLAAILKTATEKTADDVTADASFSNITLTKATVATAVDNVVAKVATAISVNDGTFAADAIADKVAESDIIDETTKTTLNTAVTEETDNAAAGVTATPVEEFVRPEVPVTTPEPEEDPTGATGGAGTNV